MLNTSVRPHTYSVRLCVCLLFLLFSATLGAQTEFTDIGTLDEPEFSIDYARFRATNPLQTYVEVYYMIAYDNLQFVQAEGGYRATYEITAILYDDDGRQVQVKEWRDVIFVERFDETNDYTNFKKDQTSFVLDPRSYKLLFKLVDAESKKQSQEEREFKAEPFDEEKLSISDIEFASYISPDTSESRFVKNARKVIPNVSRLYGASTLDLYLYYEIYHLQVTNQQKRGTFNVLYEIRDSRGRLGLSYETTVDKPGQSSAQSLKLDLSKLKQGEQTLEVTVKDNDTKKKVNIKGEFAIQWSDLFMVENDFDMAIDQLRYIAGEDQIRALKNAPVAERKEAWNEFWKSKDPTPGTPQNELKKEYYRRIRFTNANYSSFGRNGWKNDMGAVYIIYGPPSEIERHPYEFTSKPYEIWYYYAINRSFLFVDENGFGDYRLHYPDWYDDGIHR